jgi:murein tripeptide amidase MpaA
MSAWLYAVAAKYPELVRVESYGKSHAGRDLLLAMITEIASGEHATKPAHWIDADIHSTEVTSGVAAMYVIQYIVGEYYATCKDEVVVEALRTRAFYVAPRINPDGIEDALADSPSFHCSSVRHWPYHNGHRWPGLHIEDVDGDGRILTMRIVDPDGAWMEHPDKPRVMVPIGPLGVPGGRTRYRLTHICIPC